jgi:deoxycytidine triphosphate deaminase
MYLGKGEILKRIEEEGLLENLDLENVQGSGVDLAIDRLFELTSPARLGVNDRALPEMKEIEGDVFEIPPGAYYLLATKERVNMPSDLVAFILPRSTLFRSGVSLRTAVVDPGYRGILTIGIKNEGAHTFTLERYARIAQIVFSKVKGPTESYNGKYQGGRVG